MTPSRLWSVPRPRFRVRVDRIHRIRGHVKRRRRLLALQQAHVGNQASVDRSGRLSGVESLEQQALELRDRRRGVAVSPKVLAELRVRDASFLARADAAPPQREQLGDTRLRAGQLGEQVEAVVADRAALRVILEVDALKVDPANVGGRLSSAKLGGHARLEHANRSRAACLLPCRLERRIERCPGRPRERAARDERRKTIPNSHGLPAHG
jgi:hypothetical protein